MSRHPTLPVEEIRMTMRPETELYAPVKRFLEEQGYRVRGEVKGCDLVAVRGDELVVVELKAVLNLTLILQGIERLKLTDAVYLAVEEPSRGRIPHWSTAQQLCRRLGFGLLTVRFGRSAPRVEVVCDPVPYKPRPAPRKRRVLLGEFQRRSGDHNTGGSARGPRVTAYREEALRLADELNRRGPLKVKDLRDATGCEKAGAILGKDFYGWFERVSRGVYQITPKGQEELATYARVIESWGLKSS